MRKTHDTRAISSSIRHRPQANNLVVNEDSGSHVNKENNNVFHCLTPQKYQPSGVSQPHNEFDFSRISNNNSINIKSF